MFHLKQSETNIEWQLATAFIFKQRLASLRDVVDPHQDCVSFKAGTLCHYMSSITIIGQCHHRNA